MIVVGFIITMLFLMMLNACVEIIYEETHNKAAYIVSTVIGWFVCIAAGMVVVSFLLRMIF